MIVISHSVSSPSLSTLPLPDLAPHSPRFHLLTLSIRSSGSAVAQRCRSCDSAAATVPRGASVSKLSRATPRRICDYSAAKLWLRPWPTPCLRSNHFRARGSTRLGTAVASSAPPPSNTPSTESSVELTQRLHCGESTRGFSIEFGGSEKGLVCWDGWEPHVALDFTRL